jgi:DNA-binding beta-propeller fold protein YncE
MKGAVLKFLRVLRLLLVLVVMAVAPASRAMWHCGDIALDSSPGPFLIDPVRGDILVAVDAPYLVRVDEATLATSRMDLPAPATALALDPAAGVLYALHEDSDRLTAVVMASGDTAVFDSGDSPVALAVDALRQRLFVLNQGDSTIQVFDGMVPTAVFACPGSPSAVAIDPATGCGYAVLGDADLLFRLDPATSDTACIATGPGPVAIEVDPERREFYIANSNADYISVFRADSDSILSVVVGFAPTGLAVNTDTHNLFVIGEPRDMAIVNTVSLTVTSITLPSRPQSVCVDPLSDRGLTVLPSQGLVVDLASTGDTSMVFMGGSPAAALVNPITDKGFAVDPTRLCIAVFDAAHYEAQRVSAGGGPGALAINFETHNVYTPNYYTKNMTIIDGYTNAKSTLKVADSPNGVVIDPITDDVYVLCAKAAAVVVKRSDQPDTVMASIGAYGHGMALNLNTGTLYVSNRFSRDMSVINMQTLDTTLVRCGGYPCSVAADMENNMIYVANRTSWTLTVVSGADLTSVYAQVGHYPILVKINPATNTVYTLDSGSRSISAVDATTLERTKIPVGLNPSFLSINANTNTIYVSSRHDGEVTVVNGQDLTRRPAGGDVGLGEVEADRWLDRAFAVSWDRNTVSVIDGDFLSTLTLPVGYEPHNSAYDPVLEKLYVTNHAGNSVEVFKLRDKISPRTVVAIDPLAEDVAHSPTPTISGVAVSQRAPQNHGIMKVLYKVDNLRGAWQEADLIGSGTDVAWEFTTQPLLLGEHLVFVAAIDSSACTLSSSSSSSLLRISDITCYEFTCITPPPEPPEMLAQDDGFGGCTISWSPTCGEGGWYEVEIAGEPEFADKITVSKLRGATYAVSNEQLLQGKRYWRVAAIDYPHGKRSDFSPVYCIGDPPSEGDNDAGPAGMLLTAFPNPSPAGVTIRLLNCGGDAARCLVYDVSGRLVETLQLKPAGSSLMGEWSGVAPDGEVLPSGVYYVKVNGPGRGLTHKIILLR